MSAQIFTLAAADQAGSEQPNPSFTKKERAAVRFVGEVAVRHLAARDFTFNKYHSSEDMVLISGKWEAAPTITLSKKINMANGSVFFMYFREGGKSFSDESLEAVRSFAIDDLKEFGAQTTNEVEGHASERGATGARSRFHVVQGGRTCQPG